MVRAEIHGWNMYYRRSVILLDFIHNPACSIRMQTVTFSVPQERLETWQIVTILLYYTIE